MAAVLPGTLLPASVQATPSRPLCYADAALAAASDNGMLLLGILLAAVIGGVLWLRAARTRRLMSTALTAALQHRERLANRMAMIANRTDSALVVTDCSGCVEWVNEGFTRMTGYLASEVMGRRLLWALDVSANSAITCGELRRHLRTGDPFKIELRNQTSSGKRYLAAVEVQPLMDEAGRAAGYSVVAIDVTQRARAEEELRKAHDELDARVQQRTAELAHANAALELEVAERQRAESEARQAKATAESASRAKSDFLANMSHEIRTPMTAILGYADLLLDPELTVEGRLDHVNTIRRNGAHLLRVINDILDVSKIEAGEMKVERVPCETSELIADVVSTMRVRAVEKNLKLEVVLATPVPATIETDPTRFRQIVINLLGNAIKFTESGWVRLCLRCADVGGANLLFVDIVDSGIGMTPEQQSRVFEPFAQGDTSTTRKFGGTGLGLTISRKLARMLGGDIEIDSVPGRGSTFSLSIDPGPVTHDARMMSTFEEVITQTGPAPVAAHLAGRLLLAEDGLDNQQLLSHYLRKAGADVVVADNGKIAVEKVLAAVATGQPFDLVLMDMQMPELDGYGATLELRRRGLDLPIIALTAHAMSHERANCMDCGCTDFLSKPTSRQELIHTVAKHLPAARTANVPGSLVSTAVDDQEVMQFLPQFIQHLPEQVSRLEELLRQTNLGGLQAVLHQLKGTCGMYGFPALTDMAGRVEESIKDAAPIERLKREVQSLIAMIESVQGYESSRCTPERSAHSGRAT